MFTGQQFSQKTYFVNKRNGLGYTLIPKIIKFKIITL